MTKEYPEANLGESFASEYELGEQTNTQPLLDAKQETLDNLWLAVMGKVGEMHKEKVKRDIEEIIRMQR